MDSGISISKIIIFTFIPCFFYSCKNGHGIDEFSDAIAIPARGNSWVTDDMSKNSEMISDSGIVNWGDAGSKIETYFLITKKGTVRIALRARAAEGRSKIECTLAGQTHNITIRGSSYDTIDVGTFEITNPGYNSLSLSGLTKTGRTFADISDILVAGEAASGKVIFVKDDFYWGRRGPSVHLRYEIPADAGDIEWFYNEITVPEGNDVTGSYFMANGFTDGYFGIQVNSPDERRILFSVWSPYKTDNPKEIPDDYKILLLRKGESVHAGEFGNEGSGGQSYLKYMWKAGTTYRFLLEGKPSGENSTDYTAYFYGPETGKWHLIASFRRPQGSRYLANLYSFLENFMTETGAITRKGYWSNQWICTNDGKWIELTGAKFTVDATARKEARLDYAGGTENGAFFLQNCGFFNEKTEMNTTFTRQAGGKFPEIDFKSLK